MKNYRNQQSVHPQWLSGTRQPLRRALNLAILAILYPSFAQANPDGAQVVSGQVSIDTATPGVTTITNSPNAIINWQNFSIGQNELTQFIQQNSQSAVLNRIIGQNPSEILGQLTSNGKVFLINPNGVVFGPNSMVDTQGLVASSLNLSDQDFLSGNYHFMAGASAGSIVNEGIIRAGKDGNIVLIAPQIDNNGIIRTEGGSITLAAGQELTITSLDDPEIRFQIQAPADQVLNIGKLLAEGGAINVFAGTIKHSGEINADSVEVDQQGHIRLVAQQDITLDTGSKISADNSRGDAGHIHIDSQGSTTLAEGRITAKATETGTGGSINLLGEQVAVQQQAIVNASGQNGGGQILVGGDYQGKNQAVHNARTTEIGQDAVIKANAKTHGDGGKIIVWSDETTRVHGSLSATGGSQGGNGGFIETSGSHLKVAETAHVSTLAPNGKAGTWLIDPNDFTIASSGGDMTGAALSSSLISNNVTIQSSSGASGGNGDIFVSDNISKTGSTATTLTLSAVRNILVDAPISASGGKLNVTLQARVTDGASGNVRINDNITTNGGNLRIGGSSNISTGYAIGYDDSDILGESYGVYIQGASISTGIGSINIRGQGFQNTTGTYNDGIHIDNSTLSTTTGTLTLAGIGGNGTNQNSGIYIDTTSLTTTGGAQTLTGSSQSTGASNEGIYVYNSTLSNSTGALTLNGTGSNGTSSNRGIHFDYATLSTTSGALNLNGTGGQGSSFDNDGINIYNSSIDTNSGNLTLNGTAGNGTGTNKGINIEYTELNTVSGLLSLTGSGQGSTSYNNGIDTYEAFLNAGSGNVTLQGTGGNGTDWNSGLHLEYSDVITTGTINLSGTGGSNGSNSLGIYLSHTALLGKGILNLTATGSGSGGDITQSNGVITNRGQNYDVTGNYNITLTGNNLTLADVRSQHDAIINASGNVTLNLAASGSDYVDDQYFIYNLPFTFNFFGTPYTQAYISSNGLITFGSGTAAFSDSIGSLASYKAIAPAWNDWELHTSSGKNIFISKPTVNDLAVKWDVERYSNTGNTAIFEAVLNSSGNITFNYGTANNSFSGDVTIGLSDGTNAITSGLMTGFTSLNNLYSTTFAPSGGTYSETVAGTGGTLASTASIYTGTTGFNITNNSSTISALSDITLSSGGTLTNNGALSATDIILTANKMALGSGLVNGSSSVKLLSAANYAIALGDDGVDRVMDSLANTLELSTNELNNISTPILRIGNSSSGNMIINSPLSNTNAADALKNITSTLSLTSGGTITQLSGATIAALSGLYFSGASVTLAEANPASVISGSATSGNFIYHSANPLMVSTVDGQSGLNATGYILLDSDSSMTITTPITASNGFVGLWSDTGGISQSSTGTITAQSLGIKSGGSVSLNLLNSISNLAAETDGGNVSFKNKTSFNVASLSGGTAPYTYNLNGIDTCPASGTCGNIALYATDNAYGYNLTVNAPLNYSGSILLTGSSANGTEISPSITSSGTYTLLTGSKAFTFVDLQSTAEAAEKAAAAAAAQAAAEKAAKEAAEKAAQEAAEKAAQEAAEKAAKEAAEKAAKEAAEKAAQEAAEKAAQEAAEKAAQEAAEKAAQEAAEKAAKEAAEKAAKEAAEKEAAEKNQIPDLLDDESTPTEETLEETLDQVTTVVTSTQNQSNNSSTTNTENNGNPTTSDNGTTGTTGSSGKKDNSGKQCTK
jgi:filamentous hemagglutinin family protein